MRSAQVVLAFAPLLALAQDSAVTANTDALPTSNEIPVSDFLFQLYGTATPAGVTGAVATSLASALYAHETALLTDSAYLSAANDVYMAAATRSDADAIISSLDSQGVLNGDYTTAEWYVDGVPASAKSEMASVVAGFSSVQTSLLAAVSATTTAASGATTATSGSTSATGGSTAAVTSGSTTTGSGSASKSAASASTTSSSTAGAEGPRVTGGAVAGLAAVVAVGAAILL